MVYRALYLCSVLCILCVEFKNYGGSWQSIQDILYALCGGPCGGSSARIGYAMRYERYRASRADDMHGL